jgi:type I restriction enzyme S subunit
MSTPEFQGDAPFKEFIKGAPWSAAPLGSLFDRQRVVGREDLPLLSVSYEHGVLPRSESGDTAKRSSGDLSDYLVVRPGDIVFNKLSTWQGAFGISRHHGIVSPAYFVCRPADHVDPAFVDYLLHSHIYRAELARLSKWMPPAQFDIGWEDLRRLDILEPPLPEQRAITRFLDFETAKAGELVARYRLLISLLEERRAALAGQAVLWGANSTPSGPSGAHSSGAISERWPVLPLRRVVSEFVDYRGSTPTKTLTGIRLVTAANVKAGYIDYDAAYAFISEGEYRERMIRGFPELGDVLLTMEAPLGQCAQVDDAQIALGQRVMLLKVDPKVLNPTYLKWFFLSPAGHDELMSLSTGSTAVGIKASKLKGLPIPVPPLDEQARIAERLEALALQTGPLIAAVRRAIELVRERKFGLITAAATGRIGVRSYFVNSDSLELPA